MRRRLTTTSYALLGLLAFDEGSTSQGLTGYELKRRADNTLRFYWVSPATSQIYTELASLAAGGAVTAADDAGDGGASGPRRPTRRYRITAAGLDELRLWLSRPAPVPDFPVLKHPVALRLLMGHLIEPDRLEAMLDEYLGSLDRRRGELAEVRDSLGDDDTYRFPAMVADWGLAYYDAEESIVRNLRARVSAPAAPRRRGGNSGVRHGVSSTKAATSAEHAAATSAEHAGATSAEQAAGVSRRGDGRR